MQSGMVPEIRVLHVSAMISLLALMFNIFITVANQRKIFHGKKQIMFKFLIEHNNIIGIVQISTGSICLFEELKLMQNHLSPF